MSSWHIKPRKGTSILHVNFTIAGRLYRCSTGERDRGRADEAAARIYLEAHRRARLPVPASTEVPGLKRLCALYLADLKARLDRRELVRGPTYYKDQKMGVRRTSQRWSSVAEIGPGWEKALEEWHAEGSSYRSLQIATVATRALLGWVVESGYLPAAPVLEAPTAEQSEAEAQERRPMKEEERNRFLAELRKLDVRAFRIYTVLFFTGARKSDLERMTLRQIDWESKFVNLPARQTKSKKREQALFLHPRAFNAIAAHVRDSKIVDPSQPVFGRVGLKYWFLKAIEKAGIEREGLAPHHHTRHTAATMVADRGATLAELMAFGRWQTPQMAARYMKIQSKQAKKAANRL